MIDRFRDLRMAMMAGAFGYTAIALGDAERVGISSRREVERMPETVSCLHYVLPDEIVRSMAVVTGGDGVMASFHPGGIMLAHDVAIGTRGRIVGEVRRATGVSEGEQPQSHDCPQQARGRQPPALTMRHRLTLAWAAAASHP